MGKGAEQIFFQRYTTGHQVHEKMLHIIRKMQIQTTMYDHLMPERMAINKKRYVLVRMCTAVGTVNWYSH